MDASFENQSLATDSFQVVSESNISPQKLIVSFNTKTTDNLGNNGAFAWVGSQTVGSSSTGYFDVSYYANFSYTSSVPNVNIISNVSGVISKARKQTFSTPGTGSYYTYEFSYTAVNSSSALNYNSQGCALSYSGSSLLTKTYHFLGNSTVVSSTAPPITYNTQVMSSTFPYVNPPFNRKF